MSIRFEDTYPTSRAFHGLPSLRIPAGWKVGWNTLDSEMETDLGGIGGSMLYSATNEATRFNIEIAFRPEFDPEGAFHLTVIYAPWPRTERGRRIKTEPPSFRDAETVHAFETRSYPELLTELQHWIARCTVWTREGG